MKAVIKKGKKNTFRFILKGDNGEVIAVSELYTQKHNVNELLAKYFPNFTISDKTIK
jgi:uncharacterized protein YegP (UPF0339 family)